MKVAIECTAEATVTERWVIEVSADEFKRIKNDPDAAMEMISGERVCSVENVAVDSERDREFVSIEKVKG